MTSYDELKSNIIKVISGLTGITCIRGNQNSPRPDRPYISMILSIGDDVGTPYMGETDDITGNTPYRQQDEVIANVQCFGDNTNDPMDILRVLIWKLATVGSDQLLRDNELAYRRNEAITDVSALLDQNNIEQRASVDIIFGICFTQDPEYTSIIEDVNIEQI
jgi:hypothetical protein